MSPLPKPILSPLRADLLAEFQRIYGDPSAEAVGFIRLWSDKYDTDVNAFGDFLRADPAYVYSPDFQEKLAVIVAAYRRSRND